MKTYFVFKASGMYILVTNNSGKTQSKAYGQYPALVIDVLCNIGYSEVGSY